MKSFVRQTDRSKPAERRWGPDHVYSNGELVRIDPAFEYTYHQEEPYKRHAPLVSTYIRNDRAPYPPGKIKSTYYIESPDAAVLDAWSVSDRKDLAGWYGIKEVDGVAEFIKVVRTADHWDNCPEVPGTSWVWASLYDTNGVEQDEVDYYVFASRDEMDPWLESNGLSQPIPEDEDVVPWCYGVFYSRSTGDILGVKAYVRHAVLPQGFVWT